MKDLEMIGQAYIVWYQCNARTHKIHQELIKHIDDPPPMIADYTDESFRETLSSLSNDLAACVQETSKAYATLDDLMLNYLINPES